MSKTLTQLAIAGCIIFLSHKAFSQCEVSALLTEQDIVCGDCTEINAFGQGQGLSIFFEDFNTGVPTGWDTTQQAILTYPPPCPPDADGTIHTWFGNFSGVPRFLTTLPYDFTPATVGVTICFDMKFASQTGTGGGSCEGPDEPQEGIFLQYSTDGFIWQTIHYFDPNGGYDPQLTNWNNWCFALPQAAITDSTRIRWYQQNDSGADFDHWGLDNVNIYFNDPTYEIRWLNDNFSFGQGSSGGSHIACPRSTADYIAYMSNGFESCSDTIRIIVKDPIIELDAGTDLSVCEGGCATINAKAKVIKEPAQQKTFVNNQPERVDSFSTSVNINIQDLNMTTIQPNSIKFVCITQLNYLGFDIAALLANIGNQNPSIIDSLFRDVSDLNVYLQCPDGTRILLVPAGVTQLPNMSFTFPPPFPPISFPFPVPDSVGYINMCFVPAGADISTGAGTHYTGSYEPAEPFNDLTGCTANGLWSLVVESTINLGAFSSGGGTLVGWTISFDDIEISYSADFIWDPTTGLSDSNSLRPTVCPSQDIMYTLTATDSAGCVTESDSVNVTVDTTNLDITAALTNPSCGSSNGIVDLNVSNGSGVYLYNWSNGDSTEDLNNVPSDVYSVTVTDVAHCQEDTFFILSSANGPFITGISATGESCRGKNDGTATSTAAGGTPPLLFSWSNGQLGAPVNSLASGDYTLTVTDGVGCQAFGVITVDGGPLCCDIKVELLSADTRCSYSCDGYAEALLTNGFPPFTYQWSDGSQNTVRNDFCTGNFSITVVDRNNCPASDTITIGTPAPVVVDLGEDFTICNGNTATLDASDTYFAFEWSTGDSSQTISVSATGTYVVTVTAPDGCEGTDNITITVQNTLDISAGEDLTIVKGSSVTLSATVTGATVGNYFWEPADSVFSPGSATTTATPNITTAYTVTFYDPNECLASDTVVVTVLPKIILPVVPDAFTPNGDGRNETLYVVFNPPNSGVVAEFRVYNRWSELVHSGPTPWDGKYEGKDQPVGTFVYYAIAEMIDGTTYPMSGAFSLLR